jgi:hypothetical protein
MKPVHAVVYSIAVLGLSATVAWAAPTSGVTPTSPGLSTTATPATAPAPAATPAAPAPTTTAAATPAEDPNEIICKQSAAPTGSRLGATRTCQTRREWEQAHQDAQDSLKNIDMKSSYGPNGH